MPTSDEVKAKIRDVITSLAKGEDEASREAFHDVIRVKSQEIVNPRVEDEGVEGDDDSVVVDDDDSGATT